MLLSHYELTEKLFEAPQAAVFKAYHKANLDRPLVLKILKADGPSAYRAARFRQRIEHLKILSHPLVIVPRSFGEAEGVCFVTQDYFDGIALDRLMAAQSPLPLETCLTIACGLTGALEAAHQAGIIHGGVKPRNILVSPATLDLRLIDFISSVDVRDMSHFIHDPLFIRGTLAYTSPEQTGRIGHRVTFSSDLYSLGVVLYEMLTGRLPFFSTDPLELIHSHLAEEAVKAHDLNRHIPVALGRVVAALMVKEPEKRYQSCKGLLADLVRCRGEYASIGTIREFPLESEIVSRRVTFISKMVGRDKEAQRVLDEYEHVTHGECRSIFISGLSGIGKTRLIQELQEPIVKHRGYFTSGKFDVYQRNIPYSSLLQALKSLTRTFLTESDERVTLWKDRIVHAVGTNGRVLTDVIPELELLIGPQPEVKPLPPVEALNRFHDVFDHFLACLASAESPLVLFIDDLQWCDVASFDFLINLLSNYGNHRYLLLLGAYRHNEVDPSHPLSKLIRAASENHWPLGEIRLGPLKPEHCHEMVSYILDSPPASTQALSDFISTLSEGNPLFVSESLSYLHGEDLLYLDQDRQWRWDLNRIRQTRMPTSVVALFTSKILKLPAELIETLKYCACMGNSFSPADVATVRKHTLQETFEVLKPALREGLLVENRNQFQFIHDRVQEAVLAAIPDARRRAIHREIGGHLSAALDGVDIAKAENLFAVVSHLNLGWDQGEDAASAYRLSDLNYHAGNKALDSLATEAANDYFNRSRSLLPADCWDAAHYERTFRIFQRAAKTELMCGNYTKSEKLLAELLDHANTDLDKAECLAEQTTSLSSVGNFIKAVETANRGLAYFGKAIPDEPAEADARRDRIMAQINAKQVDVWGTILGMPFTENRRNKIELAFYSELIPDLYMSGLVPQLYLSAAQSTQHSLAGGMDESVIYSFSIMGLQLGEREDFDQAFKYEDLARELSAKYPNTFGATRGMNGIVWCNMHSRSHPRQIVDYCHRAIQCGKNCGDLYNAGLSYGPLMWNLQVQGADLPSIEEAAKECLQFSNRYHLAFSVGLAEAMQAGWIEPMKRNGTSPPMEQKLRRWEADNHVASAGSYYVHRALVHYYFGEYEEAEKFLAGVRKYLSGLTDNVLKRQWHIFLALNALKLYESAAGLKDQEALMARIGPWIKKAETWARFGPLLRPYLALLHAELARITGDRKAARGLYLDAIGAANQEGYIFLEGHINECLGELFIADGHCSARGFFVEAARLYRICRADGKEWQLYKRHPEYFEDDVPRSTPLVPAEAELPHAQVLPSLDVDYLMKSALAIAAEINQEALLKRIMNVVVEGSGAQSGYLLIDEEGQLVVRAESHVTAKDSARTFRKRLDEVDDICQGIIRYVNRTGERLILDNASQEGLFKDNADIQRMRLRSVLCLPITKQTRTLGVLYLENRLASAMFTPEKVRMTALLTAHAAISLENAALFTARANAEEALNRTMAEIHRQKELLAVTLASIGDAVLVTDAQGRVSFLNGEAERLTGWTNRDAAGQPTTAVFKIINEQTRQPVESPVARVLRLGTVVGLANHTALVSRDGRLTPIDDSGAPIRQSDGSVHGVVLVFRDCAERRAAEEALAAAKVSAEQANSAKDHFLAVLSHELRTPLTPALVAVSTMQKDSRLPADVHEDLALVRRNIGLEVSLIADLLDVSRISAGKLRLEKRPMDVAAAIREAGRIISGDLDANGQTLTVETPGAPYMMLADAARIQQVFWNLLRNAIKFSAARGRIAVRASLIHLDGCPLAAQPCPIGLGDCPLTRTATSSPQPGGNLVVRVIDSGCGISPEVLPRLFNAFEQGHPSRSFGGLGLGLSICKAVVDMHGGAIAAQSDGPGKGATFTVRLPVAQCPQSAASKAPLILEDEEQATTSGGEPAAAGAPAPVCILLVEDHVDTAKLMARLLAADGHDVTVAHSVAEGLAAVDNAAGKFGLLISDLGLPDGSGHDLMRQLVAQGKAIPGIALSGYGTATDIEKSKAAGFTEHMVKPISPDLIAAAIQRVISYRVKGHG